jgi:hypothetical protein
MGTFIRCSCCIFHSDVITTSFSIYLFLWFCRVLACHLRLFEVRRTQPWCTIVASAMAEDGRTLRPTVASLYALGASANRWWRKYTCSPAGDASKKTLVKRIELYFGRNDFSWSVFFLRASLTVFELGSHLLCRLLDRAAGWGKWQAIDHSIRHPRRSHQRQNQMTAVKDRLSFAYRTFEGSLGCLLRRHAMLQFWQKYIGSMSSTTTRRSSTYSQLGIP